ncbi:hypothetical protein [Paraburkholderia heleia]|uniref:hypothetical protein n=1 Tax=Paraburkholderia heleia TaxID=634127 RepID=UPI0012EEA549|nr:hypothetical protein [Paraburkholderia heleia]
MKRIDCCVLLFGGLLLVACTRGGGVFALAPAFSMHSRTPKSMVAACIWSYWQQSARKPHFSASHGVVRISARSYFKGVPFGALLRPQHGGTMVEYFESRVAPERYLADLKRCARLDEHSVDKD